MTHNEPKISNEDCAILCAGMSIELTNQKAHDGEKLVIRDGKKNVDSIHSYTDQRYIDIVEKLSGRVLILGLGFGSTPLRLLDKQDVSSITVVEIRPEVVTLFERVHDMKISEKYNFKIYVCDALDYTITEYDHVFIDLYHPPFDRKEYDTNMRILKQRFSNSIVHHLDQ